MEPLRDMAAEIDRFATSAYHLSTAMANTLQALFDLAVTAVIEWAAAEVAALTGVGLVATAALVAAATLTTTMVINEWNRLVQTFNNAYSALEAIAGIGFGAVVESADLPTMPGSGYDHPGA